MIANKGFCTEEVKPLRPSRTQDRAPAILNAQQKNKLSRSLITKECLHFLRGRMISDDKWDSF